jgi:hypothetical protein
MRVQHIKYVKWDSENLPDDIKSAFLRNQILIGWPDRRVATQPVSQPGINTLEEWCYEYARGLWSYTLSGSSQSTFMFELACDRIKFLGYLKNYVTP